MSVTQVGCLRHRLAHPGVVESVGSRDIVRVNTDWPSIERYLWTITLDLWREQEGIPDRERAPREGADTTADDRRQVPAAQPEGALLLLCGRVAGGDQSFALGAGPVRLGRDVRGQGDLMLQDLRASRSHAEICWSDVHGRYWLRDLASRNGTYLNGVRVARELLEPGDLIRLGSTVFRAVPAEASAPSTVAVGVPFVGRSRSLRLALDWAARAAALDAPILILGPTGTGKDLLARAIHGASGRRGPLVPVNCAALPAHLAESELFGHEKGAFSGADSARPGLFRAAEGGTLFLDEVGELPPAVQAKLLRAIDSRSIRPVGAAAEAPVDIRVLAATNRDLEAEVQGGGFRADLYARLAESVIRLDPLRDRPEDLEPLWRHFVAELGHGAAIELTGAAFEAMALYAWPGNVRELRQLVRSGLLVKPGGGELSVDDLPRRMRPPPAESTPPGRGSAPPGSLAAPGGVPSGRQLRRLVEEFGGNVKRIAAFLGKDRKQVYRWLRREDIDPRAYRRTGEHGASVRPHGEDA
jgi:DNA-binding NtrC family response regulator